MKQARILARGPNAIPKVPPSSSRMIRRGTMITQLPFLALVVSSPEELACSLAVGFAKNRHFDTSSDVSKVGDHAGENQGPVLRAQPQGAVSSRRTLRS